MSLTPEPYEMIKNGDKTIELRLNDEKRSFIRIGDMIEFTHTSNHTNKMEVIVMNLYQYHTFEALYDNLPLDQCGYDKSNIRDASPDDMLKYYSKEQQIIHGVLGIEIKFVREL